MDELPVNDARDVSESDANEVSGVSDEVTRMLAEETRRIQNDTSDQTQLLEDETILLGGLARTSGPAHFANSTNALEDELLESIKQAAGVSPEPATQDEPEDAPDGQSDADTSPDDDETLVDEVEKTVQQSAAGSLPGTVPGVIPIDETVVRPMAVQAGEEHFVVRNTRDYDHDAQSINVVASADRFETITESKPKRSRWRDRRRDPYAHSARDGQVPGEGNSRSKLRPLLAMLVVALVLCGGGAVATYGLEMWGGKTVPSMVGDTQETAVERLTEKGLLARIEATPSDDGIGKVMGQDPEVGTRVPAGSEVTIMVATNRTMPEVVGMSEEEAVAVLHEAGAENIRSQEVPSDNPDGRVVEVNPAAGEAFVSQEEIVLSIAGWYHVPDVVGMKETDALQEIENAGLQHQVKYIISGETVRTVVETVPAAGEQVSTADVIEVHVSTPYPTYVYHLAEYLDHSSQDVDSFLSQEGFAFEVGHLDGNGNAVARYTSGEKGVLTFSAQPYLGTLSLPKENSSNVLSSGAPIAGIRLECPASIVPTGRDRAAAEELAETCGFTGMMDTCDKASYKAPGGSAAVSTPFVSASGKMDGVTWTIFISGEENAGKAMVTCAKEGVYGAVDLSAHNNSISQYTAYQELYGAAAKNASEANTTKKEDSKDEDSKSTENAG